MHVPEQTVKGIRLHEGGSACVFPAQPSAAPVAFARENCLGIFLIGAVAFTGKSKVTQNILYNIPYTALCQSSSSLSTWK